MARIAPLPFSEARPETQRVYERLQQKYGRLLDPVAVTAHSVPIFDGYIPFEAGLQRAMHLDPAFVELVATKVAAMLGCAFCIDIGSYLSQQRGITERQILELADYATSDAYAPCERVAFDYAVGCPAGRWT